MKRILLVVLAVSSLLCACKPPKYALYTGVHRDFQCNVPWAWSVMFDSEDKHFTNTTFIGPFEPDFYLGAPSLSVRWYTRYSTHRLRDGTLEMYADADDFIKRTIDEVYGSDRQMIRPVQDVQVAGRQGKFFTILSPGPAHPSARFGTAIDRRSGKTVNPRQHAYVVVPMPSGFYVLIYPATQQGYEKYEPQFNQLVNSFVAFKDGPGGAQFPTQTGKPSAR